MKASLSMKTLNLSAVVGITGLPAAPVIQLGTMVAFAAGTNTYPKTGRAPDFLDGRGPQGDTIRIKNYACSA